MAIMRHGAGFGLGSGLGLGVGAGSEQVDDELCEFITSEITRGILEATPVIFGSIKEGIIELMEDCLRTFRSDLASSQSGMYTFLQGLQGEWCAILSRGEGTHCGQEMDRIH